MARHWSARQARGGRADRGSVRRLRNITVRRYTPLWSVVLIALIVAVCVALVVWFVRQPIPHHRWISP
jgi:hypothetical protein